MKFEKCMTKYSDKILSILSKSHSFKVWKCKYIAK
jgi:hypothetical protein